LAAACRGLDAERVGVKSRGRRTVDDEREEKSRARRRPRDPHADLVGTIDWETSSLDLIH
jgi:hypothetical protein